MMKYLILIGALALSACHRGPSAEKAIKEYKPCPKDERGKLPVSQGIKFIGTEKENISYCLTAIEEMQVSQETYDASYIIEIFNNAQSAESVKIDILFPEFSSITVREENIQSL